MICLISRVFWSVHNNNESFIYLFIFSELLANIFLELYENDVIHKDGFEAWHECKEPAEGKGMAIQSTVKFFTYLQENEPEEEDEEAVGEKEE